MAEDTSNTESPVAQGDQSADQAPNEDAVSGLQKRMDELTARWHEAERRGNDAVAVKDAQISELVSALAARESHLQVDPLAEVPRESQNTVRAIVSPQIQQLEAKMRRLEADYAEQQFKYAALEAGDERVSQVAKSVWADWKKHNIPNVTSEDAILFAEGIVARQERVTKVKGKSSSSGDNDTIMRHAAPPPTTQKKSDVPANIHELFEQDPEKALEIMEKHTRGKTF